nr:hypothetical protein [bacterium]
MFKQKITTYIAAIFILALLLVTIYRIQQENSVNLDTPDDYFSSEKTAEQQSIDNNYPKLAVLKSIPYFTENNYFSYRVTSSF